MVDKKQVNTVLEKDIMGFGNRVVIAECYRHAIQAATNTRSDLITINMNFRDRDGKEVISKIKEVVGSANVVSMLQKNGESTDQNVKEKRIIYYIVKSLDVNEIQSILEHISCKKIFNKSMPN